MTLDCDVRSDNQYWKQIEIFKRLKGRELWWGEESVCLREGDGWDWGRIGLDWVGGGTFMGHNKSRKWFHYTENALCIMGTVPWVTIKYLQFFWEEQKLI